MVVVPFQLGEQLLKKRFTSSLIHPSNQEEDPQGEHYSYSGAIFGCYSESIPRVLVKEPEMFDYTENASTLLR